MPTKPKTLKLDKAEQPKVRTLRISKKLNAYEREACAKRATPADEARICELAKTGMTGAQIAAETGFSRPTVGRVTRKFHCSRPTGYPTGRPRSTKL